MWKGTEAPEWPPASTTRQIPAPGLWVSQLRPQMSWCREKSHSRCALTQLLIHGLCDIINGCFIPLRFGVICYTGRVTRTAPHCLPLLWSSTSFKRLPRPSWPALPVIWAHVFPLLLTQPLLLPVWNTLNFLEHGMFPLFACTLPFAQCIHSSTPPANSISKFQVNPTSFGQSLLVPQTRQSCPACTGSNQCRDLHHSWAGVMAPNLFAVTDLCELLTLLWNIPMNTSHKVSIKHISF